MRETENYMTIRRRVVERMRHLRAERITLQASLDTIESEMSTLHGVASVMEIDPEEVTQPEPKPAKGGDW